METKQQEAAFGVTRKRGQAVVVDGPAEIRVTRINGNRVNLSIKAPLTTRVLRAELTKGDQR